VPARLFNRLDLLDDCVEVRPVARVELGMEKLPIGVNFKRPAARRNQGQRFDTLTQIENLGRQTDGLGRVVSNYTVFD